MTEAHAISHNGRKKLLLRRQLISAAVADDASEAQANVGQFAGFQAMIVIYIDGEPVGEVLPTAVNWTLVGPSEVLSTYQPTVAAATANFAIPPTVNPIAFYCWKAVGGASAVISIQCTATAPDGEQIPETVLLALQSNQYSMPVPPTLGQIQIQTMTENNRTFPVLSFGDSVGTGPSGMAMDIACNTAAYPGWLGAIQLVNSLRQATGASRTVYPVTNTNNAFVLDVDPGASDYMYGKAAVALGQSAEFLFDDTPVIELPSTINNDPIVRFDVSDQFALYFVFNGSLTGTPNADAQQIWFPIGPLANWGWTATAENQNNSGWVITTSNAIGPTVGDWTVPLWNGTIQGQGTQDVVLRKRRGGLRRK